MKTFNLLFNFEKKGKKKDEESEMKCLFKNEFDINNKLPKNPSGL